MNYPDVLAKLRPFKHIMVTGPQRSGTTIAAKMLASDLGYEFASEEAFRSPMGSDFVRFIKFVEQKQNGLVIQAPTLSAMCHLFNDIAVVFMRRSIEDIIKSQRRIRWRWEAEQKSHYFYEGNLPVSQVKYQVWERWQRPRLGAKAFDLDYETMRGHPLWIEKRLRVNFRPRQTAVIVRPRKPVKPA